MLVNLAGTGQISLTKAGQNSLQRVNVLLQQVNILLQLKLVKILLKLSFGRVPLPSLHHNCACCCL